MRMFEQCIRRNDLMIYYLSRYYLCVMLSYKYFNELYLKLLGCIDECCENCWMKLIKVNGRRKLTLQLHQVASKSQSCSDASGSPNQTSNVEV